MNKLDSQLGGIERKVPDVVLFFGVAAIVSTNYHTMGCDYSQLEELREKKRALADKLAQLERRCEAVERRENERNSIEAKRRKEEVSRS